MSHDSYMPYDTQYYLLITKRIVHLLTHFPNIYCISFCSSNAKGQTTDRKIPALMTFLFFFFFFDVFILEWFDKLGENFTLYK